MAHKVTQTPAVGARPERYMRTFTIDDRFIREQERVEAREIARACNRNEEPDFRRIERRAYAETIDRALARGGKI